MKIFACRLMLFFCLSFGGMGAAWSGEIKVISAALLDDEQGKALSAEFSIKLGPRLEQAVNHGLPLNFRFEFNLTRDRWYWIDEHIVGRKLNYQLSHHALTRQYRLTIGGLHQGFDSLTEALSALGRIAQLHVVDRSMLQSGETYQAAVRLSLDHTSLPKPVQVDSLTDSDWRVKSEVGRWTFVPAEQQ